MTKLKPKQVALVLQETGAVISHSALCLGVSRTALYKFLEKHPEVNSLRREIEDNQIDTAEFHIAQSIRAGDLGTIRWYLARKGKARGYSSRHELT